MLTPMCEARGILVLTPVESKRLISKAVAKLPEVKKALEKGKIVVGVGSTNAFVAEELLGREIPREKFLAGYVSDGKLRSMPRDERMNPVVLIDGQVVDISPGAVLKDFESDDVFIKGANAVDHLGNAGVFVAHEFSGTIGEALPRLVAVGAHLIVPVGLEKLIPDVMEAVRKCGQKRLDYAMGHPIGIMPLVNGKVITEIQALRVLFNVTATHVGSGGIFGSEGAASIVIEGSDQEVADAMEFINSLRAARGTP